jgi:hypothetical protein
MPGLGQGSVGVTTTGNRLGDTAVLSNVNKILDIFAKNLQDVLDDFKVGSFNEISSTASLKTMDKAAVLIGKNIRNRSTSFNKARELGKIFQEVISGWQQTASLNDDLANVIINNEILQNKVDEHNTILNNRELLLDYLHQKSKQYSILPKLQVASISAALKPEYNVYIVIWGYPPNGIWDSEKLSNIILDLKLGFIDEFGNRIVADGYTKPEKN